MAVPCPRREAFPELDPRMPCKGTGIFFLEPSRVFPARSRDQPWKIMAACKVYYKGQWGEGVCRCGVSGTILQWEQRMQTRFHLSAAKAKDESFMDYSSKTRHGLQRLKKLSHRHWAGRNIYEALHAAARSCAGFLLIWKLCSAGAS